MRIFDRATQGLLQEPQRTRLEAVARPAKVRGRMRGGCQLKAQRIVPGFATLHSSDERLYL